MKYTNKYNLPDAYVRAVSNDPYDNQGTFTPSSLSNPPLATALLREFPDDIEVDVSSRAASIIGSGAHFVAERAARPGIDLCEERFFSNFIVDDIEYKVSAAIDLYETDTEHLMDWKTTKAYAFSKKAGEGKKPEWICQMNIGAELLRRNGHNPKRLSIIAILKDWLAIKAGTPGCPEQEVIEVDIPMWESKKAVAYIEDKIRIQMSATINTFCKPQDNWAGRRCAQWCDASSVCSQFKEMQKTGLLKKQEEEA